MYKDGYFNITNVDISSVVISQMSQLYSQFEEMECNDKSILLIRLL